MRIHARIFLCASLALVLTACNISDDDQPALGNSGTNNSNNSSSNSSTANNTSPNNVATDAGNNVTSAGCTADLSICPEVNGAEVSECIEGICVYQCKPGQFDANQDLERPDGDGCESDCIPTNDGVEACDGLDNDCNGVVDDGFGIGNTCSSGVGACEANGRIVCNATQDDAVCDAVESEPGDEICDGIDNNCDGEVDEGNPGSGGNCDTGQPGACQNGTETCSGGDIICEPNNQPVDEFCGTDNTGDGIDNNCDGEVDEGCGNCPEGNIRSCYTGALDTRGVGECEDGQQQCLNGDYQACLGETLPTRESCDGLDNNCDGTVDEGFLVGSRCVTGTGACRASGNLVCAADGSGTECNANNPAPSVEVCDMVDNDCDGSTDEDFTNLGSSCTVGVGACRNTGTFVCSSDGTTTQCSATPGIPTRELCGDRIDNDCDGLADEGCSGGSNCSPACLLFEVCCNDGRDWSCYGRPPANALCEQTP